MTELSYLWDGLITGDATLAPYDKVEFNKYMMGAMVEDSDSIFVIPGYLDDLEVTSGGDYSISVAAGAALLKQHIYINDAALSFNITKPATTSYYRYDFVVLRLNTSTQTIRLAIVEGTLVNSPTTLEDPTLTQTDTIWEEPIAKIFVDGSETTVLDEYIYDQRQFAITPYSMAIYPNNLNLLKNSEYMAWAASVAATPEYWIAIAGVPATKLDAMARGQAMSFTGDNYATQILNVPINNYSRVFTIKGSFIDVSGSTSVTKIEFIGDAPGAETYYKTQTYTKLEAGDEVEFQFTFKVPDTIPTGGYSFYLIQETAAQTTQFGQAIIVSGYHPGPYRQISEIIPFEEAIADANWTDTAKSTGTTTIDFSADFNAEVLPQTKAVILRVRGRDSGSAAGSPYIEILGFNAANAGPYGRLWLEGVPNNIYREMVVVAPVNQWMWLGDGETPYLRIDLVATGAATLDATVEVIGIII